MSSGKVLIGLDGGGTKTLTVCVDQDLKVIGRAHSACSNHNSVGPEKAKAAITEGVTNVLKEANRTIADVAGICLGMSGVDRPSDRLMIEEWLAELLPGVPFKVGNDALIALASGTDGHFSGVVVISGTGTISYAFARDGRTCRAQGWGPILGDEGSGYHIGELVLRAVMRAKDEMGPQTSLTNAVLSELQVEKEEDLVTWAYSKHDQGWQRVSQLSILAHKCAKEGDAVATQILDAAAAAILSAVSAVIRRLDLGSDGSTVPLVLAGGNLDHDGSILTELLIKKLSLQLPFVSATRPKVDSAVGAALLAYREFVK